MHVESTSPYYMRHDFKKKNSEFLFWKLIYLFISFSLFICSFSIYLIYRINSLPKSMNVENVHVIIYYMYYIYKCILFEFN